MNYYTISTDTRKLGKVTTEKPASAELLPTSD